MGASKADELRRRLQWTLDASQTRLTRSLISAEKSLYNTTQRNQHGYYEFYMVHSRREGLSIDCITCSFRRLTLLRIDCSSFSMVHSVLIKLDAPRRTSDVSHLIRQAWKSLYTRIPTLSVLAELSEEGSPTFVYQHDFEESREEQWVNGTFQAHAIEAQSSPPDQILQEVTAQVCRSACPFNVQGHAFLDATILDSDVTETSNPSCTVALTLRTSHLCFDGTGVWHVMHALLASIASGATSTQRKQMPEPSFLTYFNSEIIETDHSLLAQQLLGAMRFPNGHLFAPVSTQSAKVTPAMGTAKRRLSRELTTGALLRCRQLGVTVSQLLQACFIVALLEVYPAVETSQIFYDFPINLRDLVPLPKPFFGNAIDVTFNVLPCQPLTENVRQGMLRTSEDAISVHRLAQALTSIVVAHRSNAVVETLSLMTAFEALMEQPSESEEEQGSASVQAPPIVCTADGLLDRYIASKYHGDSLDLQVVDADVMLRRTTPLVNGRSYSFDGRLTFLLTFTLGLWAQSQVDTILATSLRNMEFVLASGTGEGV